MRARATTRTAVVGRGDDTWRQAAEDVLAWRVKTRSGFAVEAPGPPVPGQRLVLVAGALGIRTREPIEVTEVVRQADRVVLGYRTLPGHPVHGAESFVLTREGQAVRLTIDSRTSPAESGAWRALFPLLLVAQRVVQWRYLRALRQH
ncbi:DUF1990 family protein [Microbacterium marinilacus]|uniref:DUF1990 domain-containing protein n=1 Tax=Microbacterium marinilacus TaxID=415209 RepID=A0ABP7B1Z0_9MICO|nr:DUF1990 family protein [Microbacterium marinilacus]MBY0688695.1 DUF1990 domain-containing protein [Microbacterium marinilacus]